MVQSVAGIATLERLDQYQKRNSWVSRSGNIASLAGCKPVGSHDDVVDVIDEGKGAEAGHVGVDVLPAIGNRHHDFEHGSVISRPN